MDYIDAVQAEAVAKYNQFVDQHQGGINAEEGDWRQRSWTFEVDGRTVTRQVNVNFGVEGDPYTWDAPSNVTWDVNCEDY